MKGLSRQKQAELDLIAALTEDATLAAAAKLSERAKTAARS